MDSAPAAFGIATPAAPVAPATPENPFIGPTCSDVIRSVLFEQLDITGDVDIYLTTTGNTPATKRLVLETDPRGRKNPPSVRAFLTTIMNLMLIHRKFHADLMTLLFSRTRFHHYSAEVAYLFLNSLTGTLGGSLVKNLYIAVGRGSWSVWRDQFARMAEADMFRRLRYITIENVFHNKNIARNGTLWAPSNLEKIIKAKVIVEDKAEENGIVTQREKKAPDSGALLRVCWQPNADPRLATVRLVHWSINLNNETGWMGFDPSGEKSAYDVKRKEWKAARARLRNPNEARAQLQSVDFTDST